MARCYFCKGRVRKKKIEHLHRWHHHFFLFTGVQAEVCSQCGETYLGPEAIRRMDAVVSHLPTIKKEIRVPVVALS